MGLDKELALKRIEMDLAARQKDFDDVAKKHRREKNPAEKNSLQAQLDEILEEIGRLEKQKQKLQKDYEKAIIKELIKILQLHSEQVYPQFLQSYLQSLPKRLISDTPPQNLNQLIHNLERIPQGEAIYTPLEVFVANLLIKDNLPSEISISLRDWLNNYTLNSSDLLEEVASKKKIDPCLLIVISLVQGKYFVQAWLIENIQQYSPQFPFGCHTIIHKKPGVPTDKNFNNFPRMLKLILKKSFSCCKSDIKRIHFFLPKEMMNHQIDSWKIEEGNFSPTIGADYDEIVIRYSDRLKANNKPITKWREKGRIVKANLHTLSNEMLIPGEQNNPFKLLKELNSDSRIAVRFNTALQSKKAQDTFDVIFQAGIPIALWSRKTLNQINSEEEINTIVNNNCPLGNLPQKVREKRNDAMGCDIDAHIGHHLSLLWDDPDLVPPQQLLIPDKL